MRGLDELDQRCPITAHSLDQAAPFQQMRDVGVGSAEVAVGVHSVDRTAPGQQPFAVTPDGAAARHMREENAVPERPLDRRIRLWLSHARHGSCDATIDRQVRVDTGLNEY